MRLASVQMLRAIAAIMVVYSHARPGVVVFARTWKYNYLLHEAFGVFGVDIFFVISGFVICYSADRLYGRKQALGFLWNRFRRINLIYYVATMATLLVWLPSLLRHERLPISTAQILSSAIVIPFPGSTGLFLSQGWTLTYEWYFYLLFFLLILFGTSKKEATLGIVLASLIFMGWLYRKNSQYLLGVYTNPIMFEFLLGVGIGYVFRRWTPGKTTALLLLIPGLVLGIGLTIVVPGYGNFPTANAPKAEWLPYTHALIWGSAAALIVAGCIFLEKTQTRVPFQNHRLILLLGDASYSIYLFHIIIFGFIAAFNLRAGLLPPPDFAVPVDVAIAVAASTAIYKWVEVPLLKRFKKLGAARKPTPSPLPAP